MLLTANDVNTFLNGIMSHARAGNFDHVSMESALLLKKMEAAIRNSQAGPEIRRAVPSVRELLSDSGRSDARSLLEHVRQAKNALGIEPGVTPSWSGAE